MQDFLFKVFEISNQYDFFMKIVDFYYIFFIYFLVPKNGTTISRFN